MALCGPVWLCGNGNRVGSWYLPALANRGLSSENRSVGLKEKSGYFPSVVVVVCMMVKVMEVVKVGGDQVNDMLLF